MPRLVILAAATALLGAQQGWSQTTARQAGYLYLSPVPQASFVSDQNQYILVRFANVAPAEVTNLTTDFISVSGAMSGSHAGMAHVASDQRTVIFQLDTHFSTNELVTVNLNPRLSGGAGGLQLFQYQFMTTAPMPTALPLTSLRSAPSKTLFNPSPGSGDIPIRESMRDGSSEGSRSPHFLPDTKFLRPSIAQSAPEKAFAPVGTQTVQRRISASPGRPIATRKVMVMPNGVSVPSDFPQVAVTVSNNPSPGYLFFENVLDSIPPYTLMLDNNGLPVWYQRGRMFDFKIQDNAMITYGRYDDNGVATFYACDQNFSPLRTYAATNGYVTDAHELKVLPDGRYFIIGYRLNSADLSQFIPGATNATVLETVIQGFTAASELVFQWRAWDNYDIRDLVPLGNTDFPHMNGLDIDDDGNLLVSSRHLSEITKINLDSGDIIWRLSGAHSSFTFTNDPFNGTSYQHNISALGKGHYLVFDNGDTRSPQVSRAVEYQLDLTNMIAAMAWQYRETPDAYADVMGSAQRLPTGNTLINFVLPQYPKAIEVDTNGVKRFELNLAPNGDSYRQFRFPWSGIVAAPYLVLEEQPDNVTLIFNKFGDSNVAYYRIYGGTSPHPTTLLAESATTYKQLNNLVNGLYYFRVTAVNADDTESPFSNEESANVNITQPGQNEVQNGDFSRGTNSWFFEVNGNASASWAVQNGVSQFSVTNGGTSMTSVQLLQWGQVLIQGQQYVLQFDAWSDQSRYMQVLLVQNGGQFLDYGGLSPTFLTPNRTHYQYVFSMAYPSDFSANLVFELGSLAGAVNLANISLFRTPAGDFNLDGHVDATDLSIFCGNWLKQQKDLPGDLDGNGVVDFNDFVLFGQNWGVGAP